jgi:hypothetical protein
VRKQRGFVQKYLFEVLPAIAPMAAIIAVLGIVCGFSVEQWTSFIVGVVFVIAGMTLFLGGINMSMMEVGRLAGSFVTKTGSLPFVILFGFVSGFLITVAEPDVKILAQNVASVSGGEVSSLAILIAAGIGVGVFMTVAVLRILMRKSFFLLMLIGYAVVFAIAVFCSTTIMPAAFDSGGATTGPLTVPFMISFATGIAGVMPSRKDGGDDSFGLTGVASLGPIIAVLILGVFVRFN